MIKFDYHSYRAVTSFDSRVRSLVLHYTAIDFAASAQILTSKVSAHYLVPDMTDPSYIQAGFHEQRVFNLVDEQERAWHAGVSYWQGHNSLNDTSIGIEIVNQATNDHGQFTFPPYEKRQIAAVIELTRNILQRYPEITPTAVVGHSDIAPYRKSDPGPAFPWFQLYQEGIGAWYDDAVKEAFMRQFAAKPLTEQDACLLLQKYGYDIREATNPQGFAALIRAFQMHFRPACYSGILDLETMSVLAALVSKYVKS